MRSRRLIAVSCVLALPALASALDVPVQGRRLQLRASERTPSKRSASVVLADPALAAPFPDPRTGASLVISAGAGPGLCRAEVPLDPGAWEPLGGDGPRRGWRYRAAPPGTQGIRRIVLRPGRLRLAARGAAWPCDLAAAQALPVSVIVRAAGTRYCAAFGGDVVRNAPGRFAALDAPAPAACPKADLTVANLNFLHGLLCPTACRLADRVELLFQWIVASGCPDVVTLQEVWDTSQPLITAKLPSTCPFPYQSVFFRTIGIDDEMILSRFPVLDSQLLFLEGDFRHVTFARIDHPIGPVDVFATHLSSGSDAQVPCVAPPTGTCPAECVAAGAATRRECQGVQMASFVAARHDVPTPAVATGDFNEPPASFVYDQFALRGWTDTYLAAGNPECEPLSGVGCTSGRLDTLAQLESPVSNVVERIDYIFLVPPGSGSVCAATLDPATDADGDATATRIFADTPNPFAPACGPAPDAICWPSDHEGAELDLNCG
jgi:endonuclease/exonuclease/phosphatase family metal-dependent hydrolase